MEVELLVNIIILCTVGAFCIIVVMLVLLCRLLSEFMSVAVGLLPNYLISMNLAKLLPQISKSKTKISIGLQLIIRLIRKRSARFVWIGKLIQLLTASTPFIWIVWLSGKKEWKTSVPTVKAKNFKILHFTAIIAQNQSSLIFLILHWHISEITWFQSFSLTF